MSQVCAYVHCKPNGEVFYVGKGKLARAKDILKGKRNKWYTRTIAKYGAESIGIGIMECSSEAIAFDLEKGIIKCLKAMGVKLTNMTDGGEGKSGCPNSPEAYASAAAKLRGRKRSADFRKKASEWMAGRTVSEETRAKISSSIKKLPLPEKFIASWGLRKGALNGRAKAVIGTHPEHGNIRFATLTAAAEHVDGTVSKLCRSIKLGHKHKGWIFMYEVTK